MKTKAAVSSLDVVSQLWKAAGLPASVLTNTLAANRLQLPNDPGEGRQSIRSSFLISAAAQGSIAATALAQHFHEALVDILTAQERSHTALELGEQINQLVLPAVSVDARHAVLEFKGWTRVYAPPKEGAPSDIKHMLEHSRPSSDAESRRCLGIPDDAVSEWDSLAGLYHTKPGTTQNETLDMVRIHTNFPHHKLGILQLLSLAPAELRWTDAEASTLLKQTTREQVQDKLWKWTAVDFETEAQKRKMCVTAYRSSAQWTDSSMGKAVTSWVKENSGAPFRISRLNVSAGSQAGDTLIGKGSLRVVEMSRVIAGPTATRTLAAHGAKVLLLSNPGLPNLPITELDTTRGKRTAYIELGSMQQDEKLDSLLRNCDIFSQAYRPNGLADRGLSPQALQTLRPGVVYLELRAFGFAGPWSETRGFDSLTQTASGLNYLESTSFRDFALNTNGKVEPKAFPVQALDYTAGFLMSFTALACRCRGLMERSAATVAAAQGWHVQISLASTAEWIKGLGRVHGAEAWLHPPENIIPADLLDLWPYVEAYRVRGQKEQRCVLAIRHAGVVEEGCRQVPTHLNLDALEWW